MNSLISLWVLLLSVTTVSENKPTADKYKAEHQSVVSLENDTLDFVDIRNQRLPVYVVYFKQPYCHDCLPEALRVIKKMKGGKRGLYVIHRTTSVLNQRTKFEEIREARVHIPKSRYLRYSELKGENDNWRGHLYLEIYQDGGLAGRWNYNQIMNQEFLATVNAIVTP